MSMATYSGPFTIKELDSQFDALVKEHFSSAPRGAKLVSKAKAVYCLSGRDEADLEEDNEEGNHLQIELEWIRPKAFLETPSLDSNVIMEKKL